MPVFDTGLFLILTGFAIFFLLASFRYMGSMAQVTFNVLGMVIWFALALFLVSGWDIATVETNQILSEYEAINSTGDIFVLNSTNIETTQTNLITPDFGFILGFIYMIIGLFSVGIAVWAMMPHKDEFD